MKNSFFKSRGTSQDAISLALEYAMECGYSLSDLERRGLNRKTLRSILTNGTCVAKNRQKYFVTLVSLLERHMELTAREDITRHPLFCKVYTVMRQYITEMQEQPR